MIRYPAFLEGAAEEIGNVVFYAHRGKDDGKFLVAVIPKGSLLDNLGGKLVVGKAVPGEDGKLLPAD